MLDHIRFGQAAYQIIFGYQVINSMDEIQEPYY